jgi:hypothetical protein
LFTVSDFIPVIVLFIATPKSLTAVLGTGKDLHNPANPNEVAVFSGMPAEHAARTVVIGQRMLKTLQSGAKYANQWTITWKHSERWTNPLMGYTSSADPMSNLKVSKQLMFYFTGIYMVILYM